jgi:hypothetical protein
VAGKTISHYRTVEKLGSGAGLRTGHAHLSVLFRRGAVRLAGYLSVIAVYVLSFTLVALTRCSIRLAHPACSGDNASALR